MQFKYGTSRIALLIPFLGIAIKFPRVYGLTILKQVYYGYLKRGYWKGLFWFLTAPANQMCSFRYMAFAGVVGNVSEFMFYLKTRNRFACPTYFSFFGLINIQQLGETPAFGEAWDIHRAILNIGGNDIKDSHCFSDVFNFVIGKNGQLYLLDYASSNSQLVLKKYESALCGHFKNYAEKMFQRESIRDKTLY